MTEYAGKEVMLILVPKDGSAIKPSVEYFYHELQKAAEEHIELAFKKSKQLNEAFGTPDAAVKQFFEKHTPESVQNLKEDVEKWLQNFQMDIFRGQMEELINKQIKLAFKQSEKLKEIFSTPEDATREFIKKYTPESTQKIIDDVEAWVNKVAPQTLHDELQAAAQQHIKLAFKQYNELKKTFGTPTVATDEFMKKYTPESVQKLEKDIDAWLKRFKPKSKK